MSIDTWSDLLRILIFVVAFLALGASVGVIAHARRYQMSFGQVMRFVSLSIFLMTVLITEIVRLGHDANWHTWLDLAGSLTAWAGNSMLVRRHFEKRSATPPVEF